jgi:hypothetical protein
LQLKHAAGRGIFEPMSGIFEAAASGRAKCRGCAQPIKRGEMRFGERLPNPYAEGEMTLWFHPACAAYKRPEPLLEALITGGSELPDREALERAARSSLAHPRLARIDGAERSRSGQAACRSCRLPIERDSWRIRLVYYEDARFSPAGYVHIDCRMVYFETDEVLEHLLHFSAGLSDAEREALRGYVGGT